MAQVSQINKLLAKRIPLTTHTYTAINAVVDEEFPAEFLNSIEVSGLLSHILELKPGMPVMLLRSIKSPELTNGTRCIVRSYIKNTVEVEASIGFHSGPRNLVPRIPLRPSDTTFPFLFKRKQFSLRFFFAMTVNKTQGQTLTFIDLNLRQPIFAQIKFAMSWQKRSCFFSFEEFCSVMNLQQKVVNGGKKSLSVSSIKYRNPKIRMIFSQTFRFSIIYLLFLKTESCSKLESKFCHLTFYPWS